MVKMSKEKQLKMTILMPCLNEERTIGKCIEAANNFLLRKNINGEILIVDNGCRDASIKIAKTLGARIVREEKMGYGNALITGISHSFGQYIIFGDCDMTYDFDKLDGFYEAFEDGFDMVIGNRFNKNMEKGAMSFFHKIGVRFLSWCGRRKFKTDIRDFHCGLRGITQISAEKLDFCCEGMEFATEFIAQGAKFGLEIKQIFVTLHRGVKGRKSHLRTISDGFRHLKYILKSDKKRFR